MSLPVCENKKFADFNLTLIRLFVLKYGKNIFMLLLKKSEPHELKKE